MTDKKTYIMENVANTFRHEANIRSFTPYKKIKSYVNQL